MLVLKDSRIGEVTGGPDAHHVTGERPHGRTANQGRPCIGVVDLNPGEKTAAEKIQTNRSRSQRLTGCGICHLANKTIAVFPGRIGIEDGGVIKREELASGMHGLRESDHLADGERNVGRIALKVVLGGKAVLRTEDVIDIPVDLGGVELARWAFHERVEGLVPAFWSRRIG